MIAVADDRLAAFRVQLDMIRLHFQKYVPATFPVALASGDYRAKTSQDIHLGLKKELDAGGFTYSQLQTSQVEFDSLGAAISKVLASQYLNAAKQAEAYCQEESVNLDGLRRVVAGYGKVALELSTIGHPFSVLTEKAEESSRELHLYYLEVFMRQLIQRVRAGQRHFLHELVIHKPKLGKSWKELGVSWWERWRWSL